MTVEDLALTVDDDLLEILCCPACRDFLHQEGGALRCRSCGHDYPVVDGIPVFFIPTEATTTAVRLSAQKWQRFWAQIDWEVERAAYERENLPYIYRHLLPVRSGERFLEVGGGPSYLSFSLAGRGLRVCSVDVDLGVLRRAKAEFTARGRPGQFVCADFNWLPFREGVFHLSAGIGALEHGGDLNRAARELARVATPVGRTFQTVPSFSILTLVTNSLRYGTVPQVPILQTLVPLVHIGLLRSSRMRYGYEESYTWRMLRRSFVRAGFRRVEVGFYDYGQVLLKRYPLLAAAGYRLVRLRVLGVMPFADVAYLVGEYG